MVIVIVSLRQTSRLSDQVLLPSPKRRGSNSVRATHLAAAAMRMLLFHFGVRRQSPFIGRHRFGLHSFSLFAHAIRKRRRRFALPAHSKSLHAFRSLGGQANIDFRFATSGFGVTARDTLLELIDGI